MKSAPRTYFATKSPDDIGELLIQKVQQYPQHRWIQEYDARLQDAWRYYYGYDHEGMHATSQVLRGGDQGELAKARVNHARALVNALLNLVTAPKFVWTPRASSLDYEAIKQTRLATQVLEHYWHNARVAAFASKACEESIVFTEGFVHLEWDDMAGGLAYPDPDDPKKVIRSGDLRFSNVSTWDVIRNPSTKSWEDLNWVIVRLWKNRYDLAARYPDAEEDILDITPDDGTPVAKHDPTTVEWDSDEIPLFVFYHKPTPSLPFGREVRFLSSGKVLSDRTLDLDSIPLYRVTPGDITGKPFGYSSYHEILGLQEIADSVLSSLTTNITSFGTQNIAVEKGSDVSVEELTGARLIYFREGGKPPEGINFMAARPEQFQFLDSLKDVMELLMGLNSVVRGEAQSDRMSGAALALLQSQALQQASHLVGNYNRMVEALGTGVIRMIRARASHPLKIAIVGKTRHHLAQEADVSSESLNAVEQVYVELGNPISQSAAGRMEIATTMLEQGLVKSPEQLQEVLTTGRLDPITQADTEEFALIMRENQSLSEGKAPPVLISDNHLLHAQEHKSVAASPAARENPDLTAAYLEHMHQHYALYYNVPPQMVREDPLYHQRMLMLLGQQPPPMPEPPPGEGPPPEGGPPPEEEEEGVAEQPVEIPGAEGSDIEDNLPSVPVNPATGQRWDPGTGGGIVPPQ